MAQRFVSSCSGPCTFQLLLAKPYRLLPAPSYLHSPYHLYFHVQVGETEVSSGVNHNSWYFPFLLRARVPGQYFLSFSLFLMCLHSLFSGCSMLCTGHRCVMCNTLQDTLYSATHWSCINDTDKFWLFCLFMYCQPDYSSNNAAAVLIG